jgi:glycosyltransferase involved in cell wall biosynthesis
MLPALRALNSALTDAPPDLPASLIARTRRHVDTIEDALARSRALPEFLETTRRSLESLEASTAGHWRHLHDLTERPGYRLLDGLARRVRRPRQAEHAEPAASQDAGLSMQEAQTPPIAVAVIELREFLAAVAQQWPDDPALTQTVERAQAELGSITSELTVAQALQPEVDELTERLRARRARLADLQDQVHAVQRRINSRLLDGLRMPARSRREAPEVPAVQGESPRRGWPGIVDAAADDETVLAYLEVPEAPAVVLEGEALQLVGWALTPRGPVSRVEVLIDGKPAGRVQFGYVRADVHAHYQLPHALLSGFDYRLDPAVVQGRVSVNIDLVAVTAGGRRSLVASRQVWVARAMDRPIDIDSRDITPAGANGSARATKTPHLLVVTHDLGYGGGQIWLLELLDRMGAGRDFPATVVSPAGGPLGAALRRLGIAVHVNGGIPADRTDAYEGRLRETAAWAAPQGFTHVLVNTLLAFAGADLASRLGLPCIWAIHESWPPRVFWSIAYPPGGIHRQVQLAALRALAATNAVIFEAEATRALYADYTRPGASKVVRYGVRTRAIRDYCAAVDRESARRQLGLTGLRRILLVMGTVEPRKGQTLLALAFQQIAQRHPDTALVFVGAGDTPYVLGLTEYLGLVGLNHQVRVEPVVADSSPWYRAADALVCASDVESMPRTVLEAMAFGLPVLSTAIFGLPELITDGQTGFLYDAGDVDAAVAGLERLLTASAPELAEIAAAGCRHVFDHYDSAGYADHIKGMLHTGSDDSVTSPH